MQIIFTGSVCMKLSVSQLLALDNNNVTSTGGTF